jgi:hypothetical protein
VWPFQLTLQHKDSVCSDRCKQYWFFDRDDLITLVVCQRGKSLFLWAAVQGATGIAHLKGMAAAGAERNYSNGIDLESRKVIFDVLDWI